MLSTLSVVGSAFSNAAGLGVSVNISHPRTSQLTLNLTSPGGTKVVLWHEATGAETDIIGIFPTTLEPQESMAAFDGEDFNGQWELTVEDSVATQTGTLNSWGINIRDKVTETSESSPIVLNGLTNPLLYTCTVSAITALGRGSNSGVIVIGPEVWDEIFLDDFEASIY